MSFSPLTLYSFCVPLQELYKNLNLSISPNLELEDSLLFVGEFVLFTLSNYIAITLQNLLFYQKLYLGWFFLIGLSVVELVRKFQHRVSTPKCIFSFTFDNTFFNTVIVMCNWGYQCNYCFFLLLIAHFSPNWK